MNEFVTSVPGSPLLDHCPESLPAQFYYDRDHHAREIRQIWMRNWIYAGRANDLPPMTVRRISAAGENLILAKDRDGTIRCFHNTCRHRGAELCQAPDTALKSQLVTCPYHAWSYDMSGKLVRTPFASLTLDFRKEDHGLLPVHVHQWNGFLFVCLAETPPEFSKSPDLGAHALDNWPMEDLVTGHTLRKRIVCNWKVFWENYNECLHCPGIHPELCDMVPVYGRGYMAANEAPDWTPEQADQGTRLKRGARTWTMNGRPCGPEFSDLTEEERSRGQTFVTLLPTMYVVAHVDYVRAVSLNPIGPEETELRAEWLFLPETMEAPGFDLDNVTGFASLVMLQDGEACEMNQRGLRSSAFKAGRLMPQEFDVHNFQEWVRRQLVTTK